MLPASAAKHLYEGRNLRILSSVQLTDVVNRESNGDMLFFKSHTLYVSLLRGVVHLSTTEEIATTI